MSIKDQIPLLESLADLDEKLRRVEAEIALRKGGLASLASEVEALTKKAADGKASVATMEKTRNELLIEVRQMTQQVERSREKLGRSRNERESVAATREIEELRKLLRDREDEVEKLNSLVERARTSIDEAEGRRSELTAELEGSAEGATQSLNAHETERLDLATRREAAAKSLPPVLYRRYEAIRSRRPRAIASTSNGTCNGCHIAVPPMMFQTMLKQAEFDQCPNCRRILYYLPRPEPAGTESP